MFAVPRGTVFTDLFWSTDPLTLIEFGTVDNPILICDFISIDIIHPEAQRSTLTSRHAALLLHFSDSTGMKWGSNGLFPTVHSDANWWTLTPGFTHSFLSAAMMSAAPSGSKFATQRKRPLKERCVDQSYCSCLHHLAHWSHPGRRSQNGSVLNVMRPEHPSSLSVSLSVFVKAQTSQFSHITKGLCQHTVCRPGVKLTRLSTILHLHKEADKSLYNSFSLYPRTQFNSTDHNMFFFSLLH